MTDLHNAIEQDSEELENAIEDGSSEEEGEAKGRPSMRKAINAYCKDCGYDPLDKGAGNWRQQVGACPVVKCHLWPLRPGSKPKK